MGLFDKEYVSNNKFIFSCTGFVFSFSKISSITSEVEYDTILEGGYNEGARFLVKPKTKVEKLVLEQGVRTGVSAQRFLKIGMPVYVGTIIVLEGNLPQKVYCFEEGIITKYEMGELDALDKKVLVKKLEISHSGLYEV